MSTQKSKVHIVTGKGGVGKSAVACAMAVALAESGKRVLLAELNGRDRAASFLGVKPTGYTLREVFEDLTLVDINPRDSIREYALLVLRFEALYKAVFENNLVRHFIRLVPSLGELTMLGKIWYHAQEQVHGRCRFDDIVVDAPATGHAVALMSAPRTVSATIPTGPMRDNAKLLDDMLTDMHQTAVHMVTTPEDMPVTEALELYSAARSMGIATGALVINQRVGELSESAIEATAPLLGDPRLAAVPQVLRIREQKRVAGEKELLRFDSEQRRSAISLPRIVRSRLDLDAVKRLAEHITPRLEEGAF